MRAVGGPNRVAVKCHYSERVATMNLELGAVQSHIRLTWVRCDNGAGDSGLAFTTKVTGG